VIGINPYVTNSFHHGHPLYPLLGPEKLDILTDKQPADFLQMNRGEKLITSIFTKTGNPFQPAVSSPKWPFTIEYNEFETYRIVGIRTGGMGSLFGGIVILSLPALVLIWITRPKAALKITVILGVVGFSILINPACWWARYVPQLWFLPLFAALTLILIKPRFWKCVVIPLLVVMTANVVFVSYATVYFNQLYTKTLRIQFHEIARGDTPAVVYFDWFRSNRVRLQEQDIEYQEVSREEDLPCSKPLQLTGSIAKVCY